MDELYRFTAGGTEALVTNEFLVEDIKYDESRLEEFREPTGYEGNLQLLGQVLDWVMSDECDLQRGDSDLDAAVAPAVRRCIDIPLRAAGDHRLWNYLAVGWRPDYVRYRWPPDEGGRTTTSMREKFTKSMRDLYAPAFGRLWFMAELSRQGENYGPTEELLKNQFSSNRIFDRNDLRQPDVVEGFSITAEEEDSSIVENNDLFEATAKSVSHELSSISAPAIGSKGVKNLIQDEISEDESESEDN
jgi:hypothetical protein